MNEIPVSVMWWLTVGMYGVTAVLCLVAGWQTAQSQGRSQRSLWFGLSLSMLLLGINKQQDLTGILTRLLRRQAFQADWYFSRQSVQLAIITAVALVFGLLLLLLVRRIKNRSRQQSIALFGIFFLAGFALVRAVSLHLIDALLYQRIGGIQPNWIVELGGIALVAIPAIFAWQHKPHKKEVP